MYKVELITPSLSIANFNRFSIRASVYQLANTAYFVAFEKDFNDLRTIKTALKQDLNVKIKIDGELVLNGYIAAADAGYYKKQPVLLTKVNTLAGRLVDSYISTGQSFRKQPVAEIIKNIIGGYEVNFINQSAQNIVLPSYTTYAGQKIDEVLTDLARCSNTLLYSDTEGNLIMADKTKSKFTTSALITGDNIIDIRKSDNVYSGYQEVVLHSQLPLDDNKDLADIVNTQISGKSKGRSRSYHETVDYAGAELLTALISELEENAYDLNVVGSSYRTTENKLYQLNSALKVKDNWLELNDSYLITEIEFSGDSRAYQAKLNLEEM